MNFRNADQAVLRLATYHDWEQRWNHYLRHRTYACTRTERPTGVPDTSTWWYTHRDLRTTRGLFRRLIANNELFTWIDPTLSDDSHPLLATASPLEGSRTKPSKTCSAHIEAS